MELVENLQMLITDLKWLVRIGKWLGSSVGVLLLALLPLVVAFMVHVSGINARMASFDSQLMAISKTQVEVSQARVKHAEQPYHAASGQSLTLHDAKINDLCVKIDDLKKRVDTLHNQK